MNEKVAGVIVNTTHPRVTEADILEKIKGVEYYHPEGTTLTICIITMKNGFNVTGTSACVHPDNFDKVIGESLAYKDAKSQIWQLEGYLLAESIMNRDALQIMMSDIKDFASSFKDEAVLLVARVCHEVNRAYCRSVGDESQESWDDAPQWKRDSAAVGVDYVMKNPDATPEDTHNKWLEHKVEDGWVFGAVKDVNLKTHPCMLPYSSLPKEQRIKDSLFLAVVRTMTAPVIS